MRKLILANRHYIAFAEKDVAGLMDGIREQKSRERMPGRFHLGLHRRIAMKLGFGNERQERQHELVARRHCRMREDARLFWIEAASKIIDDHVIDVVLDMLGGIAVGNNLVISDDHARGHAFILKVDAFFDRAEIVTEVQTSCRSITCEHDVLRRMLEQVLF